MNMTKITVEIYGSEAEFTSVTPGNGELLLLFPEGLEGFIGFSDKSFRISSGKCLLKLNQLRDGEIRFILVTQDRILRLPKLIKDGNSIYPANLSDSYIRALATRERALEKQVTALEKRIDQIEKSVYGTTLFK